MTELPFGFDRPEDSPGFLLWQTTMVWQRRIKKALEEHGVSHAQFVIMANLMWFEFHKIEVNQVAIAHQTKLDKMTVSKSLKNLVAAGYVSRLEHKTDTRAKSVTLTEKGKQMVCHLVPIVEKIDKIFFDKLSIDSQRNLAGFLLVLAGED
jgi:DNA-binding MarR family transcriptional regulator